MKSIVFFGSSLNIIVEIKKSFLVKAVICETPRATDTLKEFCQNQKISLHLVNSKNEIPFLTTDAGVSFGFGLIFSAEFLAQNSYKILNIHPGSLLTNRGRHPLHWNIFLAEPTSCISFHQITSTIDEGPLVKSVEFHRDPEWNLIELEKEVERQVCKNLPDAINSFVEKNTFPLVGGQYRQKFSSFNIQKPEELTSTELIGLTKIQMKYGGLKIGDTTYIDARPSIAIDNSGRWQTVHCKDQKDVQLLKKEYI